MSMARTRQTTRRRRTEAPTRASCSVCASFKALRLRQAIEPREAPPRSTHNTVYVGFVGHNPAVRDIVPDRVEPLDVFE
jgi:hypothetical protein